MTDDDRPMVRAPLSAKGAPCPLCGRPRSPGKHLKRAGGGEKCMALGCGAKLFETCEVDGVEVASSCLGFVVHRLRT